MHELVKDLEIEPFMQSKLVFANNIVSTYFLFFFLVIDLCFLVLEVITQMFNPIVELIMSNNYYS